MAKKHKGLWHELQKIEKALYEIFGKTYPVKDIIPKILKGYNYKFTSGKFNAQTGYGGALLFLKEVPFISKGDLYVYIDKTPNIPDGWYDIVDVNIINLKEKNNG